MLWVPQKGIWRVQHNLGATAATSVGTGVTAGGTGLLYGTVTELIASTDFDSYWMQIFINNIGGTGADRRALCRILIGAATEQILIPDLVCGQAASLGTGFARQWGFPLYVPAGSRLSAQLVCSNAGQVGRVGIVLYGGDMAPKFRVGTRVTTYGVTTAPDGTAITPGTAGAEGSWTEMTASTSRDHFALVPGFQGGSDISMNNNYYWVDLGIGAATEEEVAQSYIYTATNVEAVGGPFPEFPAFVDVPAGTRLVMRASCSGTPNTDYSAAIHGVS